AKEDGYRSRAAYKLLELNEKFKFLKKGVVAIDLGAAPGGWTQVLVEKVNARGAGGQGKIIGIDLQAMEPIAGAILLQHDFTADDALELLAAAMDGRNADIVLSDMAAPACGH